MARKLTANEIAAVAEGAGFKGLGLQVAIAVALAESEGDPGARGWNPATGTAPASYDRGLWQINDYWHKEIATSCADDPACAARAVYRISAGGNNWSPWSTYKNGAYQAHMAEALAAMGGSMLPAGGRAATSVTLFNGVDYTGRSAVVTADNHYIAVGTLFGGGDVRSLKVDPPGSTVTLYQFINYGATGGGSFVHAGDIPDVIAVLPWHKDDRGRVVSSLRLGASGLGATGGGFFGYPLGGGAKQPITDQGFAGLAERLSQIERFDWTPHDDLKWHIDFGSLSFPGLDPVTIATDVPLVGSGAVIMLAGNLVALLARALIVWFGLFLIQTAIGGL